MRFIQNMENVRKGYIAFYNLNDWFYSEFSSEEINFMEQKYEPLGSSSTLTTGTVTKGVFVSFFLANLLGWFYSKERTDLCLKIATKAEELFSVEHQSYTDIHFYYQGLIQFYYKLRTNDEFLNKAIYYCNKQIEIAPLVSIEMKPNFPKLPRHIGYEQLAIIEKKYKNWQKVIDICKEAQKQKWNGTWKERIEEAKKHLK